RHLHRSGELVSGRFTDCRLHHSAKAARIFSVGSWTPFRADVRPGRLAGRTKRFTGRSPSVTRAAVGIAAKRHNAPARLAGSLVRGRSFDPRADLLTRGTFIGARGVYH